MNSFQIWCEKIEHRPNIAKQSRYTIGIVVSLTMSLNCESNFSIDITVTISGYSLQGLK